MPGRAPSNSEFERRLAGILGARVAKATAADLDRAIGLYRQRTATVVLSGEDKRRRAQFIKDATAGRRQLLKVKSLAGQLARQLSIHWIGSSFNGRIPSALQGPSEVVEPLWIDYVLIDLEWIQRIGDDLTRKRSDRSAGKPVSRAKNELDEEVGVILQRAGIRVTESPDGKFASVLQLVYETIGRTISFDGTRPIARRVKAVLRQGGRGAMRARALEKMGIRVVTVPRRQPVT